MIQKKEIMKAFKKNKRIPIAIRLASISDVNEINKLYDNYFNYLKEDSLPCYITVEGFTNNDYSWFGEKTSNKNEILKNYTLVTIEEAKKIHIETPDSIKESNKIENEEIDSLFARLAYK